MGKILVIKGADFSKVAVKVVISVKASPINGGTVSSSGSYIVGQEVEITAVPAKGYKFVQWSDGDKNATHTITITNVNTTYTATFEEMNEIDVDSLTKYDMSMGERGWYTNNKITSMHTLIEVIPGEKYGLFLIDTNDSINGFYGFLSSAHTEPVEMDQDVDYVSNTGRIPVELSEYKEFTIPTNTKYLCLNIVDGAGHKIDWALYKL